ncbi:hypothetical protein NDU88_004626 [Pleurodeles waltl]|uniref:Uncharacterized protein n=1 Tax=Pleurodeles waltl TaxID=8319 RepID=A0AAV7T8X1_PLEWA|nr:hypothetical protein NDU88_004626 [Pleurodeles waltl]
MRYLTWEAAGAGAKPPCRLVRGKGAGSGPFKKHSRARCRGTRFLTWEEAGAGAKPPCRLVRGKGAGSGPFKKHLHARCRGMRYLTWEAAGAGAKSPCRLASSTNTTAAELYVYVTPEQSPGAEVPKERPSIQFHLQFYERYNGITPENISLAPRAHWAWQTAGALGQGEQRGASETLQ